MDTRQIELHMEGGVEDPEPLIGPSGAGRIPRDPQIYKRVAAAFNGAFKTEHGHYGMMVDHRVLLPPVPNAATVAVFDDGRIGFGTWGSDHRLGGIAGISDEQIVSFRQNLDPLVDHGQINPTGRTLWGFTLPGKGAQTERSALCVTTAGHVVYAWGDDLNAKSLGRALQMAGCDYAMHLDMNPYHSGFLFTAIDDFAGRKYRSELLAPAMTLPSDRYIQSSPKDFFYVTLRDPTPPPAAQAGPWEPDPGLQPPPHWLPGLWRATSATPAGPIELVDVEPGRVVWRLRAGTKEAPLASPLRDMSGEDAPNVAMVLGLGVAPERHPLGLATDGRLAVSLRRDEDTAVLILGIDGRVAIERGRDDRPLGAHDDLAELPLLLWEGDVVSASAWPASVPTLRAAFGIAPGGRVVWARGVVSSAASLGEALARAGCTRAVLLDRGSATSALRDRSGTDHVPRTAYEQTVLYAVGTPLAPRAFRFEPATTLAQAKTR